MNISVSMYSLASTIRKENGRLLILLPMQAAFQ